MNATLRTSFARNLVTLLLSTSLVFSIPALAAPVILATSPLATSSTSTVSPNLMLMLDDSGSMDWDYMPDNAKNFSGKYGYNSNQCNGVYYNPAITYAPPVTAAGVNYPSASFAAAWNDGYDTTAGTTNLGTGFTGGSGGGSSGINLTAGSAFYYTYSGSLTSSAQKDYFNTSSPFYVECNTGSVPTSTGNGTFTKVIVTAASAEATNFANWYSYYSNRMFMMKTGVGLAFKTMNSKFRVGFMTMNNNVSPGIVNIAPFNAAQKTAWYTKLYGANPGNTTPLRQSLSQVGQLYANKFAGSTTYKATITVSGSSTTTVSSVRVLGIELLNATTTGSNKSKNVASNISSEINGIATSLYSSTASGSVVTITGPAAALGSTPVIISSGTMTLTATAFTATTVAAQLNGITPTDPMEYSCQKNFVILSTDGYWNSNTGYKLDNTAIGNQDGTAPRPMYDGVSVNQTTSRVQKTQTQVALSTTQTQQRTTQVQARTSSLQSQTSQLQTQTSALQSQTSQLQTQTSALQSQTSQLQAQTSALQSQTSQLQTQTSALQSQTSQLQARTSVLTGTVNRVLLRCNNTTASCGTAPATGVPNALWVLATSCTTGGGTTAPRCARISPSTTITRNVNTTCNTAGSINGASPYTATNTDGGYQYSSCQYTTWTPYSGTSSCTNVAQSGASPYTVLNATQCQTAITSAYANALSCTANAVPDGSGNTTQCQYTAFGGWAGTATCTAATQSASPNYTVGTARNCQTVITSAYANAASCTANAVPNGSGNTTQCQYLPYSSWAGTATCTPAPQSASPNYTVGTARNCQTVITSAYANAVSCTANAVPNGSGNTTQCQYLPYSSWAGTATCTPASQSASPNYTVGTARNCQTVVTAPYANAASCTVTTPNVSGMSTQCAYTAWSAGVGSATCTPAAQSAGPTSYTVGTATQCTTVVTTPYANAASCTTNAVPNSSGNTTQCQYTTYSAWSNASSCAVVTPSGTSPYTVGTATQCQTTDTGMVAASACTPSVTGGQTITCNTVNTGGPTNYVASCTPIVAAAGNSWTATACTSTTLFPTAYVASCAPGNSGSPSFIQTTCNPTSVVASNVSSCVAQTATAGNGWTTITCSGSTGGTSDTLADTAMYYYQTDLRTSALSNCVGAAGVDVCENNVRTSGIDTNNAQHLTTFTLGLGARGRMAFSSTYLTDTSGDFNSVKRGLTASSSICTWQSSGVCNWPTPSSGAVENIDDLWHAAVDGRGTYFNATDPTSLSVGLSEALKSINQVTGAAAAAATSTLNPTEANHAAYIAAYTTEKWTGNLEQRSIIVATSTVSETADWCVESIAPATCLAPSTVVADTSTSSAVYYCSAPTVDTNLDTVFDALDCAAPRVFDSATTTCREEIQYSCVGTMAAKVGANTDTRTIYTSNGTALVPFDSAYATANPSNFSAAHISGLSQWSSLTAAQQTAASANLVNYLRGQSDHEENRTSNVAANWIYRYRDAVMGDALESQPAFIANPTFSYTDAGYAAFFTSLASRPGTVYVGANDGMLHAFNAANGVERWAYVPTMIIPNLWHLADRNYSTQHVNFVNGSVTISDICPSAPCSAAQWRTILVGSLNAGGRGYYALDITDPTAPAFLWEFTPTSDAHLGYSYGKPVITKKADGTWVVLVTSGYDNGTTSADNVTANSPTGDGLGHLYVLNAGTGAIISNIATTAGTPATPSGLSRFAAYNDVAGGNQAGFVYGGDLEGNLWRFDINTAATPFKLAVLRDPSGSLQPITATPSLGKIKGKRMIFVGTGKYLETADLPNTQQQTLYGIMDNNATVTLPNPAGSPRDNTTLTQQTITVSGTNVNQRVSSDNAVDLASVRGWYVDFPDTGERTNIDFKLLQGTLVVPTIVPSNTVCSPGGYGWLNYFNYETGGAVHPVDSNGHPTNTASVVSSKSSNTIVGINYIYGSGGAPKIISVGSDGSLDTIEGIPFEKVQQGDFTNQREAWRELIQ
jgi:Tfp pilus tip-associated adhesin PilY1